MPGGGALMYLFCGISALIFVGLALRRRSRYAVPFLVLTAFTIFFMMGDSNPVGKIVLNRFLDLVHDAMYVEFMICGFSLGIAVLAGIGADQLSSHRVLLAVCALVTFLDLLFVGSARPMNISAVAVEPGVTRDSFDGSRELLGRVREAVSRSNPPFRVDTVNDSINWAETAPLIEIPSPSGVDPLAMVRLMQVRLLFCKGERWGRYYQVSDVSSPILGLMNIGYLLSRDAISADRLARSPFVKEADVPGSILYRNQAVLPRFFLVDHVIAASGMEDGLRAMRAPGFDPHTSAVVEGFPSTELRGGERAPVKVIEYSPNQVVLETEASGPSYLVS